MSCSTTMRFRALFRHMNFSSRFFETRFGLSDAVCTRLKWVQTFRTFGFIRCSVEA